MLFKKIFSTGFHKVARINNMLKSFDFKKIKNDKGFTLLFAVLVSIMVLAVGTSIINISLKQVILSSSGRESQFAFYAANTGMECALYWDLNGVAVDDNGNAKYFFPPPGQQGRTDRDELDCAGTNLYTGETRQDYGVQDYTRGSWSSDSSDEQGPSITKFNIAISNGVTGANNILYCAKVTVEKYKVDDNGSIETTITSQGLNTCDPDNDTRAVQRGLVLKYRS